MQRIEAFVKAILNVESVKYSTLALFQMGNLSSIVLELMKLMISLLLAVSKSSSPTIIYPDNY